MTLQEIKDEVAKERFHYKSGWEELSLEHRDELWPEVCKRAIKAKLEEAAERCSREEFCRRLENCSTIDEYMAMIREEISTPLD